MSENLNKQPENETPSLELQGVRFLAQIEQHLKSIRNMLTFFTVLTVIGLALGACSTLLSI